MLSFDQLNPVKRLSLLVPDAADTSSIGWMMITLLAWAVLQDVHNVIYYCGRIFMHSLLSIFFSKVDVIGLKNIPTRGPLILAANHSNQFVDGICLVTSCPQRKVSILIAKKSCTPSAPPRTNGAGNMRPRRRRERPTAFARPRSVLTARALDVLPSRLLTCLLASF
jgi:hypothetical protein